MVPLLTTARVPAFESSEVAYCDTLGLALLRRCRRLERRLKAYPERDRAGRLRPAIVVAGRTYLRRLRVQRPGEDVLAIVRGLVAHGRAVVTRIDVARDLLVENPAAADAVH